MNIPVYIYILYIHGIYHEHHSISMVSKADHDAIVYEWYKSLNFQYTFNVQQCPDDLEFLGGYANRVISIKIERNVVRILWKMANSSDIPCI